MTENKPKSHKILRPILLALLGLFGCGLIACLILNTVGITGIAELISPPPGKGEKAERGYQACESIIKALSQYYMAEGEYPLTLKSLSPAYIVDIPNEVNGFPILYQTTPESYTLEFRYTGPGMNICAYTPENNWHCSGYH